MLCCAQGGSQSLKTPNHQQETTPAFRASPSGANSSYVNINASPAGVGHTTVAQTQHHDTSSGFAPPPQPSLAQAPRYVNTSAAAAVPQNSMAQRGWTPPSSILQGSEHDPYSLHMPGYNGGLYGPPNYNLLTRNNTGSFSFGPGHHGGATRRAEQPLVFD